MTQSPDCRGPDPDPKSPRHTIPTGACDCHFHIFDAPSPFINERSYTPPLAPMAAYQTLQNKLGLDRGVIIQPSIYGTDNRTTLQSLTPNMKAVVVVDQNIPVSDLRGMAEHGAVGVRVNMLFASNARSDDLTLLAKKVAELGWHIQVLTDVSKFPELPAELAKLPVPVVYDHMGHLPAHFGPNDPGFQAMLRAVAEGKTWAKLSGTYRLANAADLGQATKPLATALIEANPERMLWGTDWPHPSFDGDMPNDGDLLDDLFTWADQDTAHRILVDNPEQLYGFERGAT